MITLLHILTALASVAYLSLLVVRPVKTYITPAYISVAGTLASGILLVIVQPQTASHVCISGSIYLVTAAAAIGFARSSRRRTQLAATS